METIFLACFLFGALFTVASIVLGVGSHGSAHISHGHGQGGDLNHAAHHLPQPHGVGPHAHSGEAHAWTDALPLLNASSVVGALTWFGATGYLLVRLGTFGLLAVILGALLAGAIGWYLVARFLGLVLSGERELDPDDYRLEGTVGKVTVGIPAGGTGEVVFSKAEVRRGEAARGLGGLPVPRGAEVVIVSYANGFATVQPWGEFLAERDKVAAQNREA